ncbi:lipase maturation factor family protein [Streptacidiphilus monticola]|jgi:hypothetical protein|uniref:Lipase maturation factor family protein n=1 Tax=Streptacidiphilus monticola TaxID=2161674 RepID=A0ABW1G1D4_9ACTN
MGWLASPDDWLARLLVQRGVAAVYLVGFLAAARQGRALLGTHGLTPIPEFTRFVRWQRAPSLFFLHWSDRFFQAVAWSGAVVSAALMAGAADAVPLAATVPLWLLPWALYLSIVNVGQTWYGFGWESLLLEAGFLTAFLGNGDTGPPILVLYLLRWLLFRVEFGAGLIKMRGDSCWRDLTCLRYHHETQPMPGPLSWWFHRLPDPLHRVETAANHVTQLLVPPLLFFPQPVATAAAAAVIVTQLWLVLSGNFAWLNWLTIVLACAALRFGGPRHYPAAPLWFEVLTLVLTAVVAVLSWWPARNLLSHRQAMNRSFNPLHLVNTYGAFGSISRLRHEVVLQGTTAERVTPETEWREYGFPGKPGDPLRRPRQFAPYHLRLDWLLWFAALNRGYARPWLQRYAQKLLEGDRDALRLLARRGGNPFPDGPPRHVRALIYRYRFTDPATHRATGAWWDRELLGIYLPPLSRSR